MIKGKISIAYTSYLVILPNEYNTNGAPCPSNHYLWNKLSLFISPFSPDCAGATVTNILVRVNYKLASSASLRTVNQQNGLQLHTYDIIHQYPSHSAPVTYHYHCVPPTRWPCPLHHSWFSLTHNNTQITAIMPIDNKLEHGRKLWWIQPLCPNVSSGCDWIAGLDQMHHPRLFFCFHFP